MPEPVSEQPNTTHTYVARVWYRDTATWFNILSFVALVLNETAFQNVVPEQYHQLMIALTCVINLWIRFQSSTRPVAMQSGTTREVDSIAPKPPTQGEKQ